MKKGIACIYSIALPRLSSADGLHGLFCSLLVVARWLLPFSLASSS